MKRVLLPAALALALTVPAPAMADDAATCPIQGQTAMTRVEMFFGLSIKGRGPVMPREWQRFTAEQLTRTFPLGFTVLDGTGQWMNDAHRIVRERSKVVIVVADNTGLADKLTRVADAYKKRFSQQSVGIVTHPVCAKF
jgi:hypothetical protein